jgi:hypothetical protein
LPVPAGGADQFFYPDDPSNDLFASEPQMASGLTGKGSTGKL